MGFVEEVLHQDVAATAAHLKPVADALEAKTMTAESKFILQVVGTWFSSSNDASDPASAALNERLKRNPDVAGQRAFYGAKLPPMLEIIKSSPDIDVPR